MIKTCWFIILISTFAFGQNSKTANTVNINKYIIHEPNLSIDAAFEIAKRANLKADSLNKKVCLTILDASGQILMVIKGENSGPHNIEASRRKAFTALSTKTSTLDLLRNAQSNPDTQNLNSLPELLLLSGGLPIIWNNKVVGSIGIAGGGSPENDNIIAKSGQIPELGITTN